VKKLKDRLEKVRSAVSMQTFKHPKLFVIFMMVLINIVILLIAALIALRFNNPFTGYIDALFNGAVKWLLTPNAILDIEDPKTLALAVVVLMVGLVLFTGAIIGIATNTLKDYFNAKDSNSGRLRVENHIIILNWNNKVPELIADLAYIKKRTMNIVLMSEVDKSFAEKRIQQALKNTHPKSKIDSLNIFTKTGDPLLKRDLESISLQKASAVIIMSYDVKKNSKRALSQSDLNTIRILLSLGQVTFEKTPTLLLEVKAIETKQKLMDLASKVEALKDYTIIPVCFDRRLGQIIAQSILHPSIEDVYLSLFSFEGSEVYSVKNKSFDEVLNTHSHAIPLAQYEEDVFVLSLNNKTTQYTSPNPKGTQSISLEQFDYKALHDVYIIGSNNKRPFIETAFESYARLYESPINVSRVTMDEMTSVVDTINQLTTPVTLILLSDETAQKEVYDANVFNALIYMETHLKKENTHVIVELLDPTNAPLIKDFHVENTIISNKVVSLLLSKLALFPGTEVFYEQLLTIEPSKEGKDDYAITIEKADKTFKTNMPLSFSSKKAFITSAYNATDHKAIPFGYVRNGTLVILEGNLHALELFALEEDDEIVWMKL